MMFRKALAFVGLHDRVVDLEDRNAFYEFRVAIRKGVESGTEDDVLFRTVGNSLIESIFGVARTAERNRRALKAHDCGDGARFIGLLGGKFGVVKGETQSRVFQV